MTDLSHAIGAIERELSANEYMRHEGPENNSLRAALAILRRHDAVRAELLLLRDEAWRKGDEAAEVGEHEAAAGRYAASDAYVTALRLIRGEEGGR